MISFTTSLVLLVGAFGLGVKFAIDLVRERRRKFQARHRLE